PDGHASEQGERQAAVEVVPRDEGRDAAPPLEEQAQDDAVEIRVARRRLPRDARERNVEGGRRRLELVPDGPLRSRPGRAPQRAPLATPGGIDREAQSRALARGEGGRGARRPRWSGRPQGGERLGRGGKARVAIARGEA